MIYTLETLKGLYKDGMLSDKGKDLFFHLLLNVERPLNKAREIMTKLEKEYNPKVKMSGYKKKKKCKSCKGTGSIISGGTMVNGLGCPNCSGTGRI